MMRLEVEKNADKTWNVYCHKNKINGKRYIGVTCQTVEQRWRHGLGYKDTPRFWEAIQKYGWDSFEHSVLETCQTEQEGRNREIALIAKYDTANPEKGYNIALGGGGTLGVPIPDDKKERLSIVNSKPVCQFDLNMNFIARYSSTLVAENESGVLHNNISACCLHKNGCFTSGGYIWLYESEVKTINREDILFNIKHKRSTPVIQFTEKMELIKEYPSVQEAGKSSGCHCSCIRACAGNAVNGYPSKGYLWIYKKDYLRMLSGEIPMRKPYVNPHFRAVRQYTKEMEFVGEYESIKDAAERTGIRAQAILDNCKGRLKTTHGFIWKYKKAV